MMLTIEMLPAEYGDCVWIEYGEPGDVHRLLIDGGTYPTYKALRRRIKALHQEAPVLELLVVTHIDNDHIDGIVRLLQNPQLGVRFNDIWFNGWKHLGDPGDDALGPVQGEYLAARIGNRSLPWNKGFCGNAVAISEADKLPRLPLKGDLQLVLVSPTPAELTSLRAEWKQVVTEAEKHYPAPGSMADWLLRLGKDRLYQPDKEGDDSLGEEAPDVEKLLDAEFSPDGSPSNASSIAFLLEYGETRCLFAGDAHSDVLEASIQRYLKEERLPLLRLDAFKVPHHGSRGNVSPGLLELLRCKRFLISTNSRRYKHPDGESIARIVTQGGTDKELVFNYRVGLTERWENAELQRKYGYRTTYPPEGMTGMSVEL
jgi:hypothetical protein